MSDLNDRSVTVYSVQQRPKGFFEVGRELVFGILLGRELAFRLFARNIKAQYRQSMLGYAWLFAQPLMTTLLWFVLNGSGVVSIAETEVSYPAFVLVGSFLWQIFADAVLLPMNYMEASRSMLVKLNFPREAPVLAGLFESVLLSFIRMAFLLPVLFFLGIRPSFEIVYFPLGCLGLVLTGLCIGVVATPIGMLYSDIRRGLGMGLQLGMYLTPVVYPFASEGVLGVLNQFNPVAYLLSFTRNALVGGSLEFMQISFLILIISIPLIFLAAMCFRLMIGVVVERLGM